MGLGKASPAALAHNLEQKLDTGEDLPVPGVLALFREAWIAERDATEFRDDEDPAELAACGEALVRKYIEEVAPTIDPAAVEIRIEGEIGGVRIRGWIDLLDVDGRIVEFKTAARKPSGIDPVHRFQVATYAKLTPGASGAVRLDTLVKTKTPALVTQIFTVGEQDLLAIEKLYPLTQQAMRGGLYMPNRMSMT